MTSEQFTKELSARAAIIVLAMITAARRAREQSFEQAIQAQELTLKQSAALLREVKKQWREVLI